MTGALAAAALARVRRHAAPGTLYDAFADERFMRALVREIGAGGEAPWGDGRLVFQPTAVYERLAAEEPATPMRLPPEGSNSAAILGDWLFLKAYRRLRPGINPEVEMGRFLTEVSPFSQVVPLAGFLEYRDADDVPTTLAVLQGFVPNQGDLWGITLDLLARLGEAYGDRTEEWDADPAQLSYGALVDTLGRRIAELHRALARAGGGEAFDPEPITVEDLTAWRERVQVEARGTLESLTRHRDDLREGIRVSADSLLERSRELMARILELVPESLDSVKTRYHGDLHLGQVLAVENDVVVIDFEGEPARPVAERRAKHCPLLDVAGMVRSFDYAAGNALELVSRDHPAEWERLAVPLDRWRRQITERFLAAYREEAQGSVWYPASGQQAHDLIQLFALQKALYEIRYELHNRQQWVGIPVAGVLALLEAVG
jgi:maltose alpha-D-glucosyltransferase/alpha-amylase